MTLWLTGLYAKSQFNSILARITCFFFSSDLGHGIILKGRTLTLVLVRGSLIRWFVMEDNLVLATVGNCGQNPCMHGVRPLRPATMTPVHGASLG